MKHLVLVFLWTLTTPAFAETCVTQEQVDHLFANYNLAVWNSQKQIWEQPKTVPLCDSQNVLNKMVQGVSFLNSLPGPDRQENKSIVEQEGAAAYFSKRIHSIYIENSDFEVCASKGIMAYVYGVRDNIMHVCTDGIAHMNSPMMLAYVMVHEARHVDGYKHVFCSHGPMMESKDYGACDDSYEIQGSYGTGTGFLLSVYQTTTNPVVKQEARSNAVIDLVQRFNKLPLDIQEGALVENETQQLSFFDGQMQKPLATLPNDTQVLTFRNEMPTFFTLGGDVKTYAYGPEFKETEGPFAKKYREEFSASDKTDLVDVAYRADYSCFLLKGKMICGKGNEPEVTVQIRNVRPLGFISSSKSSLVHNEVLYVTAEDGYLYPLPKSFDDLKRNLSDDSWKKSSRPYSLLSLAPWTKGQELGVSLDQKLLLFSPTSKQWSPVPAYQDQKILKVLTPYWWSKKLEEI